MTFNIIDEKKNEKLKKPNISKVFESKKDIWPKQNIYDANWKRYNDKLILLYINDF